MRKSLTPEDLRSAAAAATDALRAGVDADWSVPAGPLQWSCRHTAVHMADDFIPYAALLSARAQTRYVPFEVTVNDETTPGDLLEVISGTAAVLADVIAAAPPDARGYHPAGPADPEGFTGLGLCELALHASDIAVGLGIDYALDGELARRWLARMMPAVDIGADDPWPVMLWATGRGTISGREPVDHWRVYAGQLEES